MQNTIRDLRQTIANLEETIAELNRRFFGISSEHSKNISLPADKESDIAEDISEDDAKAPPAKTKKSSKPRKPKASREELYASLPICEVKCPLPDDQKFCPDCGTPLEPMGYTFVREELRVIPANCSGSVTFSRRCAVPAVMKKMKQRLLQHLLQRLCFHTVRHHHPL